MSNFQKAIEAALEAAQAHEKARKERLIALMYEEYGNLGTVDGSEPPLAQWQAEFAAKSPEMDGDELVDDFLNSDFYHSALYDFILAEAESIFHAVQDLDDLDSYGATAQAYDAAIAFLDAMGINYEMGASNSSVSQYIEIDYISNNRHKDDDEVEWHTIKLRFSDHAKQSMMANGTPYNWVEGSKGDMRFIEMMEKVVKLFFNQT